MTERPPKTGEPGLLRRLFEELIVLEPDARRARLAELAPDEALRQRLESLIEAGDDARSPLDVPVAELIQTLRDDEGYLRGLIGTRVGPFRLVSFLGEGGSSAVFRAERAAGDATQTVALKLLRSGLYSADARRRFQREQSILAQLSHPSIARLIEAGVSDAGVPYIAMEYVDGLPITWAALRGAFDLRTRLCCFLSLCRAVEAAHAALVVHRDLKPSNVFVTAANEVKVLDFGVAKLIDGTEEDADASTPTRSPAMTPEYAAPEQFNAGPVQTSTDVYSLGILLGELLTGRRLNEGVVQRASDVPATRGFRSPAGLSEPHLLVRQLRGDLDAIVAKAMEEDPAQRYRSAGALADDVERHLGGNPVRAHPPTRWYRARKFVGRHRGGVVVTALFCLAILVSLAIAALQAHRANREAALAGATRDFLVDVFREVEPAGPRAPPPTVVEVVEAALERVGSGHVDERVRLDLATQLGAVLRRQGKVDEAVRALASAVERGMSRFSATDPLLFEARTVLGESLIVAGRYDEADALVVALTPMALQQDTRRRIDFELFAVNIAVKRGRVDEALERIRRSEQWCAAGCDDETRLAVFAAQGVVLTGLGRHAEAAHAYEQQLALARRFHGDLHVGVATALNGLAGAYRRLGRLQDARRLGLEAIAIDEVVLPAAHWRRSIHWNYLGNTYLGLNEDAAALDAFQRAVQQARAVGGDDDPSLSADLSGVGALQTHLGQFDEAARTFAEAIALAEAGYGVDNRATARIRATSAYNTALAGAVDAAMPRMQRALSHLRAAGEPARGHLFDALRQYARMHLLMDDTAASFVAIGEAEAIAEAMADSLAANRRAQLQLVAAVATARGGDADLARERLRATLAGLATTGTDRLALAEARFELGALLATGDCAAALGELEQGRVALVERPFVFDHIRRSEARLQQRLDANGCPAPP